jgi:CubicO group peptidase (beta-lactamase class C family)
MSAREAPPLHFAYRALPAPLTAFIGRAMRKENVPGVAVGLWHEGHAHAGGFGVTNVNAPCAVDETTLFQIGSTTKTVTATAAMRLVDRGALALDAPVRRYLPRFRMRSAHVTRALTLRHLLTHTGGWPGDLFDEAGRDEHALARAVAWLRRVPQVTPLGEVVQYANSGFCIAGRLIEIATGKTYENAIAELLLAPLAMDQSCFFAEEAATRRLAIGHAWDGRSSVPVQRWGVSRAAHPVGGLASSVLDQLLWARFHLGDGRGPDGRRLLRAATLRAMRAPLAPAGSFAAALGLSWFLRDRAGTRLVMHSGLAGAQASTLVLVPDRDFAVTVLTNASMGASVCGRVVDWCLERLLGVPRPRARRAALAASELRAYAGRYDQPDLEPGSRDLRAWEIRVTDGRAVLGTIGPGPGDVELRFYESDRAEVVPSATHEEVDFLRDRGGRIVWLRRGGRLFRRRA